MTGIAYDLKTKKVLISIPEVVEVGSDYILGRDASARGVDLTKAGIMVVEENIKEGEIIDTAKLVDKSNSVKSTLQIALERIAVLESELAVVKTDVMSLKTASVKEESSKLLLE
ncbi:MAG: hypothetical protein GYA62_11265 [Bacteroidales bacterium]|nr:hypothetical protein [Bacteroidales bacterium]